MKVTIERRQKAEAPARPATAILVRGTWNKNSRKSVHKTKNRHRNVPEQAPEGVYATSPATRADSKTGEA